jgi:hypothetical protein
MGFLTALLRHGLKNCLKEAIIASERQEPKFGSKLAGVVQINKV